jgi:hypothetical protein
MNAMAAVSSCAVDGSAPVAPAAVPSALGARHGTRSARRSRHGTANVTTGAAMPSFM